MTLKLNKETLQALTSQEADQAQGGVIVTQTYQIFCRPTLYVSQCAVGCVTHNYNISICHTCLPM